MERWRGEAERQVQRWREEWQEAVQGIDAHLRGIETILAGLQGRSQSEAQERERLLMELEQLQPDDIPIQDARPKIDWAAAGSNLGAVADRLNDIASVCREMAMHPVNDPKMSW